MRIRSSIPLVFDIARGSFVDGPGIRTIVFFKGCPLRCVWCQNPESHRLMPEIGYYPEYCNNGSDASEKRVIGKYYPPDELAEIILRDRVFYETSDGGVTFSGGEPLIFIDYLEEVSRILKAKNIHIAVETSGYFNFQTFEEKLLAFVDLILYDIKIMDPDKHLKYTGKSNELIIRNFENLLNRNVEILPRIPLIPGYTATEEHLSQIADFFSEHNIKTYRFLPYNPSGINKWKILGKAVPENMPENPMTLEEERRWIKFFKNRMNHPVHKSRSKEVL